MATYNKRGYKAPKEKEEKVDTAINQEEIIDEKNSQTAGVFSKLDEGANKTEEFVEKNQKYIFGLVGLVAVLAVGYLAYTRFVSEPKQDTAANEMFASQQFFKQALDAPKGDSLFNLALNGEKGKSGFVKLADEFSGTDSGNLANYYAGISFLNTGKFAQAIKYLEKFSSSDMMLKALAIGDANAELNKPKEALEFYVKASETNKNELTTPRFLFKAGKTAMDLKNKVDALKYFTEIKEKYETSQEASQIDGYIGMAQ